MTPRAVAACAAFGIVPGAAGPEPPRRRARAAAAALDAQLAPGGVGVVTGPSGAGKSTILRALADELRGRAAPFVMAEPIRTGRAVIDAVPGTVAAALRALAAAGLGEAPLLSRRACDLSDGQRSRLALAGAFARAERAGLGATLIVDELGSGLDAPARTSLAATLRRWAARTGVRVAAATVHGGVVRALAPSLVVTVDQDGTATVGRPRGGAGTPARITVERGTIEDCRGLWRHHYRAARPATVVGVLRARDGNGTAGVLVVSMPTLEGWWRELAWPGRFRTGDKRRDAVRLNREVRCISRVIVDPRWRGMGVGRGLIAAYLERPRTRLTESSAAMGAWCPLFAAAGMTEYRAPPARREARLADALAAAGLDARALLRPAVWPPLIRREVRRWAADSRMTRAMPPPRAGESAWRALCSPRVAYAACGPGRVHGEQGGAPR
ncbi:MAG: hypothetical protein IT437_01605 [Phycisphaerales bacterium]|nr:hypothetical protein [Phycisphaerales bacterium]